MERSVPPGFGRCEICGEFNGTTQARYLNWEPDPPESYGDVAISAEQQAVVKDLKREVAATMDPEVVGPRNRGAGGRYRAAVCSGRARGR